MLKNYDLAKKLNKNIQYSCGATLLEMMISLFVMGVGMLGILGLQSQAMRFNHQAYSYSQAVFLAQDILESMRGNSDVAATYQIPMGNDVGNSKSCEGINVNCSAQEMRDWDIQRWRNDIKQRLPGGQSSIEVNGDSYTINIEFNIIETDEENPVNTTETKRQTYTLNAGI